MKATLFMAISANGYVARKNGEEDFLSHDNWIQMLECVKEYGNLIWGSKTYEAVKGWGDEYLKDVENVPIIIVSKSQKIFEEKNVTICASPEEALKIVESRGCKKALLIGGPTINSSFAKAGLVDEIILNYNPTIISSGKTLFSESDFDLKLKLKEVKQLPSDIVQIHYEVI
jgi:dihydrofolate reductase